MVKEIIAIHNSLDMDFTFLHVSTFSDPIVHKNNTCRIYEVCRPSCKDPSTIRVLGIITDVDAASFNMNNTLYLVMDENTIKYLYDTGVKIGQLYTPVSLFTTDNDIIVTEIEPIGITSKAYLKIRTWWDKIKHLKQ